MFVDNIVAECTIAVADIAILCVADINLNRAERREAQLIGRGTLMKNNYEYAMKLAELEYMFVRVNPYVTNASVSGVMEKYFTPLLYGQYTFDESMDLIESELQLLIDEGMAN